MLNVTFRLVVILLIISITSSLYYIYQTRLYEIRANRKNIISYLNHTELKYILQWTRKFSAPFDYLESGNSVFIKHKCKYTNCFVTDDRNYFLDLKDFQAIAFNGRDLDMWSFQLPQERTPEQKYVFGAMESSDFFPACNEYLDGFFNWTWAYKLDSDFQWGYITIYDLEDNLIGPAIDMKWIVDMQPADSSLKTKLDSKSKAVAWFVSHCHTKRGREDYVEDLRKELDKFGWTIDVYGKCGSLSCPFSGGMSCYKMLENDYYFYLSFENSFAEDYVTEKLLTALNNYAVPVVYGGADYSRFLPEGSYLNAIELGPKRLAQSMNEIIFNKTLYHNFFKWHNHYKYKSADHVNACRLCEQLNNDKKMKNVTVWSDFRKWWNGERYIENCF